ncbi:cell division protein FtsI/penicillin-binding protein 2 [Nocardioides aurantiacus]|uniref:Cell division protein FtsI/penicillin-binding protein 2 n=1 Tax=Nocardioides aurantiacus TaxID=86796 RepID=A0A3N2CZ91_9ACTN|nr:cell division protein FtsI/penicillin-binding protein 2 [Nocardioides aurantiacus]
MLLPSACSLPWSGPDADAAAARLARGLAQGELEGVPVVGDRAQVQRQLDRVLAGAAVLGEPAVAGGGVETGDGTATVPLTWRWRAGGEGAGDDWRYRSTATLEEVSRGGEDVWALRWEPAVVEPSLRGEETLAASALAPERGRVLGRAGSVLVEPRPVVRVGVDKQGVRRAEAVASARRVAEVVDVDAEAFAEQVAAAGERAFVEAIVLRTDDLGPDVRARVEALPGGRLVEDELPLAPTREYAAPLLGSVGPATAEIVEESRGRVLAGDEVGTSGLQRRYDARLLGRRGVVVRTAGGQGEPRELFAADPVAGKDLATTLDPRLQQLAQDTLADVGPAAALVALQPSTGDLLVAANGPGSEGYATATVGQYAPGSTYKIVSALALLRAGVAPGDPVACPATVDVDGRDFENYDDYPASGLGRITLEDAVASSCNTAFISARERVSGEDVSGEDVSRAAEAVGLGVDRDLGFPAYLGQAGPDDPAGQGETGAAADLIGQGSVLASPLAMAAVVGSVQAGRTVVPRLLPALEAPEADPADPLEPAEAQALRRMLRAVVERGSGSQLADLPGDPVLAKTGTAEFGEEEPPRTHAWMVAAQGDLAVAVFVERGDSGSGTAGPLLRSFLAGAARR